MATMIDIDTPLSAVARVIQLAVAPVFLLTALGTFLGVLSTRLGRIVDRARVLTSRLAKAAPPDVVEELGILARRRKLVNTAITFGTVAALFVCVLIASAFIGSVVMVDTSHFVAGLFIVAMFAFIGALLVFLSEILLSSRSSPIGPSEAPISTDVRAKP
jgi:hypothetical protein